MNDSTTGNGSTNPAAGTNPTDPAEHDAHRADLAHYWARLMWYRDELWRITIPVWTAYGAFIAACVGFVWSKDNGKLSSFDALMLIFFIVTFSWVILRMYWVYANCIYSAIKKLNVEMQKREKHIHDVILKTGWKSDYTCHLVYPELHILFLIVGVVMISACIFMVTATVSSILEVKPESQYTAFLMFFIYVLVIGIFEKYMESKKKCAVRDENKAE